MSYPVLPGGGQMEQFNPAFGGGDDERVEMIQFIQTALRDPVFRKAVMAALSHAGEEMPAGFPQYGTGELSPGGCDGCSRG